MEQIKGSILQTLSISFFIVNQSNKLFRLFFLQPSERRFALNGIKNTGFYYTKSITEGKYKLPILYCLQLDGPTRYNELQRKMETATFRSLSKALKELEADGLIIRKDYGEIPPRVEYSLSDRGKTLEPVLDAFCLWGQEHRND